jgi:ribosomal protein S18 acetylase RimI-like enzyme
MTVSTRQGLYKKQTLTDAELAEIQGLARICEEHDQLDLRLNWDALKQRDGGKANDLLYYRDDVLIGYVGMDGLGYDEAEASGMVHTDHRRQGVFRALVAAAREECRANGTDSLILVFDHRSQAALAFAGAVGAQHDFSEHKMRLASDHTPPSVDSRLDFHKATADDVPAIADILAADFEIDAERLRQNIAANMQADSHQYYIAAIDRQPVGTLNVQNINGDAYVYGFVVRSELRGRGYGREILARTIADIVAARPQPIYLEVETDNAPAFGLYQSFGFEMLVTYDYYRLAAAD